LKVLRTRLAIEELNMRQQSSFSSYFKKISNSFATNFYCSNCEAERLMMISAIEPAIHGGRGKVVYQCTDCGTEKTEIAIVYRALVIKSRGKA
jgi:DNA-directed RNA polymerase subunit RPC12/RpoP